MAGGAGDADTTVTALCGPAATPVAIPRAAAVRMRTVADLLEDAGEGAGAGAEQRLDIPLPQIEAATMRALVDFLHTGPAGSLCAPLLCGSLSILS